MSCVDSGMIVVQALGVIRCLMVVRHRRIVLSPALGDVDVMVGSGDV